MVHLRLRVELDASLECGGLAPLWPRSGVNDNKAAPGPAALQGGVRFGAF